MVSTDHTLQLLINYGDKSLSLCNQTLPQVAIEYGNGSNIGLAIHKSARLLEAFLGKKFANLKAPAPGTFAPVFVSCSEAPVLVDPITKSMRCYKECVAALDLACEFVTQTGLIRVRGAQGNLGLMTIDGCQGHEGDIVFLVMGGTNEFSGLCFTSDTVGIMKS
ncbi:uncharacterized protein PgNI_00146 [Pyricularia grisea]|uniref:DNA2/NAM7 helicase-like C-terminal domain-containing protein n=1 Tax=Pyricularia grisea TaxID=148305 RepID=A0A6P8BJ39_PYRGI|nr:uncharacterized protein PgNI_00146 [Pyricularia grisea]TLD16674.1 hypothetical protein PgNI_00146 [Pyricularia grisea]